MTSQLELFRMSDPGERNRKILEMHDAGELCMEISAAVGLPYMKVISLLNALLNARNGHGTEPES